jgi:hypothetical protein
VATALNPRAIAAMLGAATTRKRVTIMAIILVQCHKFETPRGVSTSDGRCGMAARFSGNPLCTRYN